MIKSQLELRHVLEVLSAFEASRADTFPGSSDIQTSPLWRSQLSTNVDVLEVVEEVGAQHPENTVDLVVRSVT